MVKKLFIAATGQNVGKTTFSLGLIKALQQKKLKVGFIKPMGQRYVNYKGAKVDEDSVLIKNVCNLKLSLRDLSPIAMEKGFSEKYIKKPSKKNLEKKILHSFDIVSKGKDIVIIEGTGHGGVGSVFDLSNADMAKLLDAKVLLICEGGIGKAIDKVMLNKAIYDINGVEIIGVIANKVKPEKYDKIKKILPLGLKNKGLKEFGIMPYIQILSRPSMEQINESLGSKVLNIGHGLHKKVENIVVGAMSAHNAITHFTKNVVIITPGDRDDILLAAMSEYFTKTKEKLKTISGIVITGGIHPRESILELAKKTGVPIIISEFGTYQTAAKIQRLIVKIVTSDKEKINETVKLIQKYGKIDLILKSL